MPVLEVALDQSIVDVDISGTFGKQCFKKHICWDEELLLLVYEFERAVTVAQVMKSESLGEKVITDASHLHSVRCKELASIDEATSFESHWVVSLIHNEHADNSLIAIDNEVAAEFVHVFFFLDQLLFGCAAQIAVFRPHHDRNLTNADIDFLWVFIINSSTECRIERCLISERPHTTLSWVNLLLFMVTSHD